MNIFLIVISGAGLLGMFYVVGQQIKRDRRRLTAKIMRKRR